MDNGKTSKKHGALNELVRAESMLQMALVLPIGCALGWLLGAALDLRFHTGFLGFLGILLGAIGGFIQIFRMASSYLKKGN
ncbi:MAG: AtpZ/AtpI family protein [Acidobacteriaceae bacterium]|nr:AtpZ/AtpI family protein [Acidobacteriaceae bacterium]